jgi:nucleoside-diphosphate-sugar epimerase
MASVVGEAAVRVAVTGGHGFLGRHVLAALEARGVPASTPTRNELDVARGGDDSLERLGNPEVLIHLAWDGLPNYMSPHHLEFELPAQRRFLDALVRRGLPNLLVVGTCLEYGMQSGSLREDLPTRPITSYGRAKDELRRHLDELRHECDFDFTWARLFYVFGDGQASTSLYAQLRAAAEAGRETFDMSGGDQLRDYLPVETAADLIVALALGRFDGGVVNVCSGIPTSVREIAEGWVKEHGWSVELNFGALPYPDYEPMEFWGDRDKLDHLLGADRTSE